METGSCSLTALEQWRYAWRVRLRTLLDRDRADRELDDALRHHVALETESRRAQGVPPAEARRQALATLGGIESARNQVREERFGATLEPVLRDVLAIGATIAIFTIVNTVLLRPLPFPDEAGAVRCRGHAASESTSTRADSCPDQALPCRPRPHRRTTPGGSPRIAVNVVPHYPTQGGGGEARRGERRALAPGAVRHPAGSARQRGGGRKHARADRWNSARQGGQDRVLERPAGGAYRPGECPGLRVFRADGGPRRGGVPPPAPGGRRGRAGCLPRRRRTRPRAAGGPRLLTSLRPHPGHEEEARGDHGVEAGRARARRRRTRGPRSRPRRRGLAAGWRGLRRGPLPRNGRACPLPRSRARRRGGARKRAAATAFEVLARRPTMAVRRDPDDQGVDQEASAVGGRLRGHPGDGGLGDPRGPAPGSTPPGRKSGDGVGSRHSRRSCRSRYSQPASSQSVVVERELPPERLVGSHGSDLDRHPSRACRSPTVAVMVETPAA